MVKSAANNVDQYLGELPEDRRATIAAMRELILEHLPKGYVEIMAWGAITYVIPLEQYPDTYNGQPLAYLGLCAQKNYNALYMMCEAADEGRAAQLRDAFQAAGKKLDMGKSCVRFRSLDDLALDAIARSIASTPPQRYIEIHETGRAKRP